MEAMGMNDDAQWRCGTPTYFFRRSSRDESGTDKKRRMRY
jgi:hypothetical protein